MEGGTLNLIKALQDGPIIVAHVGVQPIAYYKSGVYDGDGCEDDMFVNHASVLIGYCLDCQIPHFIL